MRPWGAAGLDEDYGPLKAEPLPPTSTPMRTNTPLPTNTPASSPCARDCDGDGQVSIGDLVRSVLVALGDLQLADCSGLGGRDADDRRPDPRRTQRARRVFLSAAGARSALPANSRLTTD